MVDGDTVSPYLSHKAVIFSIRVMVYDKAGDTLNLLLSLTTSLGFLTAIFQAFTCIECHTNEIIYICILNLVK